MGTGDVNSVGPDEGKQQRIGESQIHKTLQPNNTSADDDDADDADANTDDADNKDDATHDTTNDVRSESGNIAMGLEQKGANDPNGSIGTTKKSDTGGVSQDAPVRQNEESGNASESFVENGDDISVNTREFN